MGVMVRACTEDEQGRRPRRAHQRRSPQALMGALLEGPVQEGGLPRGLTRGLGRWERGGGVDTERVGAQSGGHHPEQGLLGYL